MDIWKMNNRNKIISIVAGIVFVFFVSNFIVDYKLIRLQLNADDTPYDIEIVFDEEEYAVEYFVTNGNTDHVEIDIPTYVIDGVFMIHVNGENSL